MFLAYTLRNGPSTWETGVVVLAWLSPLINPPTVFAIGVATPLLIVAFLALVVRRDTWAVQPAAFAPAW